MDGLREWQSVRWIFTEGGTFIFLQVFTGHPRDVVSGDYPGVLMILSLFISSSEKK